MCNPILNGKLFLILLTCIHLSTPQESYPFFGVKLEPPDGKIYHGAQAEVRPVSILTHRIDWKGIDQYAEASDRQPKLIMHYISFDPLAFWLLRSTIFNISRQPHDYIPQIGLDFYSYTPRFDILNPNDITAKIAHGDYDKRIKRLAHLFIAMKGPIFLRPGYEFGGNGQGRHTSKQHWVTAWKRIFEIFKNEGAGNVAFVWNTLDAEDYMEYYPGNEYVDWWGINVFCNDADKSPFINDFVQEAANHRKPVMIAESTPRYVGSVGGEVAWKKWYQPYFNLIHKYPHLKAFCYVNASWKNYPDKSFKYDCRIQSNTFVASKFRQILSKSRFINAKNH